VATLRSYPNTTAGRHGEVIRPVVPLLALGGADVLVRGEDRHMLGAVVDHVLCVIDRSGGRHDAMDAAGLTVSSLFTSAELDAAR